MLRRAVANLRRQDWTAVVVELAVVVVGVFIGLQVSNWNEDRQKDQKAAEFTARLKIDLREEAWSYEMQIGYWSQVLANAKRAADVLNGKAPLADEALLISAYRATQFNGNTRRRATYDELTSTGEIGLIRDSALRDLAMRVYTDPLINEIVVRGQNSEYRRAFRMALPYEVQQTLGDKCGDQVVPVGDYRAIALALDYPCSTGLPAAEVQAGAAILKNDPKIMPLLRLQIANLETDISNLTVYYGNTIREPLHRLVQEQP